MIHLIVGNTGSGKTTYAKRLREETQGVIFSIDPGRSHHLHLPFTPERVREALAG